MQLVAACDSVNIETSTFTPLNTSAVIWKVDSSNSAKMYLSNTTIDASLSAGTNQTIQFKQQFTMGLDTSVKLYSYSSVNVYMGVPDLVINITGPKIAYFLSSSDTIV